MKNKILLLAGLVAIAGIPANAELTVDDLSSREYLLNHGYSETMVDIIDLQKSNINGEKADIPIYHRYDNKPAIYKWIDKFFIYLDPALDDGKFLKRNQNFSPSVEDL